MIQNCATMIKLCDPGEKGHDQMLRKKWHDSKLFVYVWKSAKLLKIVQLKTRMIRRNNKKIRDYGLTI